MQKTKTKLNFLLNLRSIGWDNIQELKVRADRTPISFHYTLLFGARSTKSNASWLKVIETLREIRFKDITGEDTRTFWEILCGVSKSLDSYFNR